jgi:hypothetical protein
VLERAHFDNLDRLPFQVLNIRVREVFLESTPKSYIEFGNIFDQAEAL